MQEEYEEKPGYYSVLPASVRYDEQLKANEKILYSEISALCNKTGYCYASNEYFSKLYHTEKETISRWISNLKKYGYICTKILYKEDEKTIDKRIIWITEVILREVAQNYCQNNQGGIDEIINTYLSKNQEDIDEKVKDNNTSINNNKNNKKEKSIFEIIEENFARTIAPLEYEEIKTWEDTELTRYVIKETILKGIHNIKYISRILEDYKLNNITTIQQAKAREDRKKGNNNNKNNSQNKDSEKELSKWEKIRKEAREKRKNERERSQ